MNRRSLSILLLSLVLCCGFSAFAQLDSRNRTAETIITDGLAQLPAKNQASYNEVIGEMAATGQKGIELLASMLKPAETNQNATFEYAIDAIVSYATRAENQALRQSIHDGLVAGLKNCGDDANKAFLMVQLGKLAQQGDAQTFASYLNDPYLRHYAIIGLSLVPGDEQLLEQIINSADGPDAELAYVAYFKKLKGVEPTLIKWTKSNDPAVLAAVYNALAVCGSDEAINVLKKAAKSVKYGNDPTGAVDAYLRLLSNLGDKAALSAAKELTKVDNGYVRCAALNIILNNDKQNATKNILAALKDKDIAYRHAALNIAEQVAGDGIYEAVVNNMKSYSGDANVDIISWLGNNHVASQIDVIIGAMKTNGNQPLALAAVASASKIGGDKALAALTSLLGQNNEVSAAAQNALLSFNGNISDGILAALDSTDSNVVAQALQLAATRHIYAAYPKIVKLLTDGNAVVNQVALKGLKGVVTPANFDEVCDMLETATAPEAVAELQAAAKSSIAGLSSDEQYNRIASRMGKINAGPAVSRYYPLLAQAATVQAIDKLLAAYNADKNEDAYNALMSVNNPAMVSILFDIAANNPAKKDATLRRYLDIVKAAGFPAIDQYRLYANALALEPSTEIQNAFLAALADGRTLPAAMLAAKYLDDDATALAAATTVKYIFAKEEGLRKGLTARNILDKAHKIFVKFGVNYADAGYAADEVAGMLNNFNDEGGYAVVAESGPVGEFENFDLYFDWNGVEPLTLTLRSMPLVKIDPTAGLTVGNGILQALPAGNQPVHVRMLNDRIFVEVGSVPFAVNEVVVNPNGKKAFDKGTVSVDNPEAVRNFYFNHLPDTPVFTLSDEEAAQGFEVLFDGRSLDKWHGNTTAYVPVDGNIYVTAQYGGTGNLYTKKNYSDFIYRFEFCFDVPGVNNGIGIRTGKDVTGVDAAFHGMEIQVLDHDDPIYQGHPYGYTGIKPYQIHGSIYGVVGAKHVDFGPIKQWHTEEIKAVGDHITVTVDGEVIVDADIREACQGHAVGPEGTEGNPYMVDHRNHPGLFNKEGYISFCGHGAGVMFRNIRILDLSDKNKSKKAKRK